MKTMKKTRIRIMAMVCAIVMVLQFGAISAMAAPRIQKAKYEKNGKVEVDFRSKVSYRNLKVTVKDSTGKAYTAVITERDDDELEFVVKKFKAGAKYTYKISGIKARGEKTYGTVSGTFTIPAAKTAAPALKVKKAKFDYKDKELDIEFNSKVTYKKTTVTVSDGKKTYKAYITERDNDELEIRVIGLTKGKTYNYTLTGICKKGQTKAVTLKGSFKA